MIMLPRPSKGGRGHNDGTRWRQTMSGKAKIEALTNSWYGFAVFSALCTVLRFGFGFFSIGGALFWLLVSWTFTFLIGRALVKKSSLVRFLLVAISGVLTIFGTIGAARFALAFVSDISLSALVSTVYTAVLAWMYARSFRTLTDASVKAYIG
jgi:hypothetical protein